MKSVELWKYSAVLLFFYFFILVFYMVANITSSASKGTASLLRKRQWSELGLHNYVKMLIIGGLFCYLFRNEMKGIVRRWLTDSSWSHGFLIPLFSLYFINQKRQ